MIDLNGFEFYRTPSEDTIEWIENILCERTSTGTLTRDGDYISITLGEEDDDTFEYLRSEFSQAEADSTYIF